MYHLVPFNLGFGTTYSASHFMIWSLILLTLVVATRGRRKNRLLPPSPLPLPVIGHLYLLGPLVHQSFQKISLKYGPLFYLKLGSIPCLVVSSPDVAKEFLKANELTFSSRRQSLAIKRLTHDSALAFVPYGPYWKFINKLVMNNLLNPRSLAQFLPIRKEEVHHFVQVLVRSSPTIVNVTQELLKVSNNIISHMMFGIRCSDAEGRADEARALVREVTQIFGEFNVADFIWLPKVLDSMTGYNVRVEDIYRRYDSLLESIITEREALRRKTRELHVLKGGDSDDDHVRDFLDILLDAMEDASSEVKVTRKIIKALIMDFLTAATDTSAISIEWTLVELINNPRVQSKAREEIDRVVGRDRLVQESDVANLPYIQAIIKETYRLHPPVPLLIRQSSESCTVNGYHIPEDTLMFVNNWAMGRDPNNWESPIDYRPERFMQMQPNKGGPAGFMELKGNNFQLLPFGNGRRGCPGVNLALQLVPTVVACMVQCFEWKTIDGSDRLDVSERPGMTAPRARDLTCVPLPRFDLSVIMG